MINHTNESLNGVLDKKSRIILGRWSILLHVLISDYQLQSGFHKLWISLGQCIGGYWRVGKGFIYHGGKVEWCYGKD